MCDLSSASDPGATGLPRLRDLPGIYLPEPRSRQRLELDSQVLSRERTIIAGDHPMVMEINPTSSGPPDGVRFPVETFNDMAHRGPYYGFSAFPENPPRQCLWPIEDLNPPMSRLACTPLQAGLASSPCDEPGEKSQPPGPEPVKGSSSSLNLNSNSPKQQEKFKKPALCPRPVKNSDPVEKAKNKEESPKKATGKQKKQAPRCVEELVTKFEDISAHTAKCDTCNHRNRQGMTRCKGCGWQVCNICRQHRGGSLDHETFSVRHTEANPMTSNEAGSRSTVSTPTRTPTTSRVQTPKTPTPEEQAAQILLLMKGSQVESISSPSPRKRANTVGSMPVRTKYPRLNSASTKPKKGTEGAVTANSSIMRPAGSFDPRDFVRRNPTRNARPLRVRFG